MGSIPQASLVIKPGHSHPIGSVPQQNAVPVMVVQRGIEGRFIFAAETPMSVGWHNVEFSEFVVNGAPTTWWRHEARTVKNGEVEKGYSFVVAEHPYSLGVVSSGQFRNGSHHTVELRARAAKQQFASTADVINWVENLDVDYWHSGADLIAGIPAGEPSFTPLNKLRNTPKGALFVYGACENYAGAMANLYGHPVLQNLITLTEARRIKFWPSKVGVELPLFDEIAMEANGLMYLAVKQSLAGPHKSSEDWLGQEVWKKASLIYRSHLYNFWRKIARRQKLEIDAPLARDEEFEASEFNDGIDQ